MYETTWPNYFEGHRHGTLNLKKKELQACLGNYMLENKVFRPSFNIMAKDFSWLLGIF
jgi:hypothetical protein